MIEAVQNMIDDLESFEATKDQILLDLVKDREATVISMNVDDQLYQGIDAEGQEVAPEYAASTIHKKRRKGDPYDRVTLRDEGDFHTSFFVVYGGDEFTLDARDSKKQWLDRKYGETIYGLTPDNIDRLSNMIKDDFVEIMRRRILQ